MGGVLPTVDSDPGSTADRAEVVDLLREPLDREVVSDAADHATHLYVEPGLLAHLSAESGPVALARLHVAPRNVPVRGEEPSGRGATEDQEATPTQDHRPNERHRPPRTDRHGSPPRRGAYLYAGLPVQRP